MQTIHKVVLTDEEVKTVEKAITILCDIAEKNGDPCETGITAIEVFDYLFKKADIERFTNRCTLNFDTIDLIELEDFEA